MILEWVAWLKDGKIDSGIVHNIESIELIDIKDFVKGYKHCFGYSQKEVEEELKRLTDDSYKDFENFEEPNNQEYFDYIDYMTGEE